MIALSKINIILLKNFGNFGILILEIIHLGKGNIKNLHSWLKTLKERL